MKVFDLDGTLANLDHRLHYIKGENRDWDAFYAACDKDEPIQWVIDLFNMYDDALILSGRSDEVRNKTVDWLHENGVNYYHVLMRPEGDYRPDEILKLEMLQNFVKAHPSRKVDFIVDDRQRVVDMWRANGYNVLQCNAWAEEK